MDQSRALSAIIGTQLRTLRTGQHLRQEQVAAIARQYGLNWRRPTVEAVEAGRRGVALEELLLLSMAFQRPLAWWVHGDVHDGSVEKEMVQLTPDAAAPKRGVLSLLNGQGPNDLSLGGNRQRIRGKGLDVKQWEIPEAAPLRRMEERFDEDWHRARILWPDAERHEMATIYLGSQKDAEMKAARRLGLSPFEVAVLSVKAWRRDLSDERDRRVAERTPEGATPRSVQALRGHVTRELVQELQGEQRSVGGRKEKARRGQ